jgi:thiopeptide-type bacteriocin biosynthesis protein
VSSADPSRRAGRGAGPFIPHPTAPILARLPLLPVEGAQNYGNGVLLEGRFLASRSLTEDRAPTARARHTDRAYLLRAQGRPTPHGVFAGVTLAEVVDGPARLHVGARHRARSNPSAAWLAGACAGLLEGPHAHEILEHLTLSAEGTATRRGDRWEVESERQDEPGGVQRCSVRATAATDLIMAVCAHGPATTDGVVGAVRHRWPQAPGSVIFDAIKCLIRYSFLITDLLPDDVSADPIGRLLTLVPVAHPARAPLVALRDALAAADAHAPGRPERLVALGTAQEHADRIYRVERPLTVDVAVDARIDIPNRLVADVVRVAEVLCRIAPRDDPAAEFYRRFVTQYGHHRYVPLLEAADPVTGIGPPAAQSPEAPAAPERMAVLGALVSAAVANRALEVELDEAAIAALAHDEMTPPHTAEVYVRLVADSAQAADRGDVRAVVTGCVSTAGSTLGRFASLLGHHHTEPGPGQALPAELVVHPRRASAQTVALPAGFAAHRIPIGVPAGGEHDLRLDELLLVSDGDRALVWSAALDRQVLPVLYARLAAHLLPPVARLLYLLGQAGSRPWHTWSWGAAAHGPFQPRITYRGTILSSARWTLPPTLVDAARDIDRWKDELDDWRSRAIPAPPCTVLTDDADRWLPLTLDHPADRELLRRYVRRGVSAVIEPPGGAGVHAAVATGPHGRQIVELVIPVLRRADPPTPPQRARAPMRARGAGLFHPGGPWLSLAVPAPPHLQDDLLLRLADLAHDLNEHWDSWFWLRYHTTELGHHLRVRFHGHPEVLGGRILPALADWTTAMYEQHLAGRMLIESYEQEIERYGGPPAIEYAERVFAADSQIVLALLLKTIDQRIAAAAHTAATIAHTVAGGDRAALAGRQLDRNARQTMNRLRAAVRAANLASAGPPPGGEEMFGALHEGLTTYRNTVPAHLRNSCASSLIHMHANRAMPATEDEPLIRALAADLIARRDRNW